MKFGVGQSVSRLEDPRLLRGEGRFVDDMNLDGQLHACVVRSPYAHARIVGIDRRDAQAMPGVAAIYADGDAGLGSLSDLRTMMPVNNADGTKGAYPAMPHLARGTVRFAGQPVAFVVTETAQQARDAAEAVQVEYEELPPVTDPETALAENAPPLHHDIPNNRAYDWSIGNAAAVERAFAEADHISRVRMVNTRIIVNAMEPRTILTTYEDNRWTVHIGTQGAHSMRLQLSRALAAEPERIRVLIPDVGGGFGMKLMIHPEYGLACAAARDLGRPVKWTADRSESFLSDLQGRDLTTVAEAATDAEGRILAMRVSSVSNIGAYPSRAGPSVHTAFCGELTPTLYKVPAIYNRVQGAYTNTTPTDAYRGAGRPEQNYIMERLIDRVGADLGIAQDEIRRRNMGTPDMMPWTTATGMTYDSGDFPGLLDAALEKADYRGFEARRTEAATRGKCAGIGIVSYMERTGGAPEEHARIDVMPGVGDASPRVIIEVGTQSTGQGHETAFRQLVHERLGVPFESIEWVAGDSDSLPGGGGTGGSRSAIMAGRSFFAASDDAIEKAKPGAADALEAAETDLEYCAENNGHFRIAGTDRTVSLFEAVARLGEDGVTGTAHVSGKSNSYPNGCHICEVEVDPDTGAVALTRYTVVDDFGTLLNPMLAIGQVQGGVVQGIGEALCEQAIYDPDTGQPLTGSLMDYALPRAEDLPFIDVSFRPTPCLNNELGAKGCGEAGSVAAAPCVVIAVLDALRSLGVTEIDMPVTPRRIWHAIETAKAPHA